jgi:hypothetical protein
VIELSRALARQFRAVLRRALADQGLRGSSPVILCQAGESGLSLHTRLGDVAVRYQHAGPRTPGKIAFLASVLAEVEGRTDPPVLLEPLPDGRGRASWSEDGVPRVIEFDQPQPDRAPKLPELPARLSPMPNDFTRLLGDAVQTTAREGTRFGVTRVQMRGKAGELVATDGRQLLVQGGVPLPWKDDLLVPRLPVFGVRNLPLTGPVLLGRTDDHVVLRVGDWTFWLVIDKSSRFPAVQDVIPRATNSSRLCLDPADAEFLVATLPRLPGRDDDLSPITLHLTTPPAVRVRSEKGGPATEAVLSRSMTSGPDKAVVTDRRYLLRAVQLGFREIAVVRPDVPLLARDASRTYVWMPLDPKTAIPPGQDVVRLESAETATPDQPQPQQRRTAMPTPTGNGHGASDRPPPAGPPERNGGVNDLIAEAEALRQLLGEAATRSQRLLAALKQHKRQARAVEAAVVSLRQLNIDP